METTLAVPTARDGEAAKTHAASETPEQEPQPDTGGVTPLPDQDASDAPADPLTTLSRRTGCTVEWLEALGLRNDRRRCIERLCGRKVIHDAVRIPLVDPLTGEEVSSQHWIPCRHPHKPGRHDDLAAAGHQWGELTPVLAVGLNGNREAIMTEGATDTFRLVRLLEAEGAPVSVGASPRWPVRWLRRAWCPRCDGSGVRSRRGSGCPSWCGAGGCCSRSAIRRSTGALWRGRGSCGGGRALV